MHGGEVSDGLRRDGDGEDYVWRKTRPHIGFSVGLCTRSWQWRAAQGRSDVSSCAAAQSGKLGPGQGVGVSRFALDGGCEDVGDC